MLKTIQEKKILQRVILLGTAPTEVKVVLWILLLFRLCISICRRIKTALLISII